MTSANSVGRSERGGVALCGGWLLYASDARPAFLFDNVKGLDMHNVKGQTVKGVDEFKYVDTVH